MNKKTAVLLSLVMVFSVLLCGCGGAKSQITFSSGETLTAKEVRKLDNTNGYLNDKVTVEMTVKKVDDNTIYSNDTMEVDCYWFSQGFDQSTRSDNISDTITSLRAGDRIRVSGTLDFIGAIQVGVIDVTNVEVIE